MGFKRVQNSIISREIISFFSSLMVFARFPSISFAKNAENLSVCEGKSQLSSAVHGVILFSR